MIDTIELKKVFDSLSKLSSDQLREKLDEAADHPLVKVYEAFAEGYELGVLWSIEDSPITHPAGNVRL